jgi:hypothetical protein
VSQSTHSLTKMPMTTIANPQPTLSLFERFVCITTFTFNFL